MPVVAAVADWVGHKVFKIHTHWYQLFFDIRCLLAAIKKQANSISLLAINHEYYLRTPKYISSLLLNPKYLATYIFNKKVIKFLKNKDFQ